MRIKRNFEEVIDSWKKCRFINVEENEIRLLVRRWRSCGGECYERKGDKARGVRELDTGRHH